MEAVVTGAFITPAEAEPAKRLVYPSRDPNRPMVVDLPAWAFARQSELGNVTSLRAFELRRAADSEMSRRREAFEREAAELEAAALREVEERVLLEEYDALEHMSDEALVELAVRRRLKVNTRRRGDVLRREVREALERAIDELAAKPKGKAAKSGKRKSEPAAGDGARGAELDDEDADAPSD